MALRLHFHSDCAFFAGCENMLVNLWNSEKLRQAYDISFSYRVTSDYEQGLRKRVKIDFPVYGLELPDPSWVNNWAHEWPKLWGRIFRGLLRLSTKVPIAIYDFVILIKLFRRIDPQIVHINNGGYPAAFSCRVAALAARFSGITDVVMVVNNLAEPYKTLSRWSDYPMDFLVRLSVKTFITGSRAAADRLRQVLCLQQGDVVPIHNGITLRQLTETSAETRLRLGLSSFPGLLFGVVALMEKRKGHGVLLEAVEHLVNSNTDIGPKFMVLLEGDGPTRDEINKFVTEHKVDKWVCFVGVEENVLNFMRAIDVLILPSIDQEDFPNVILEAMALGKPVIASRLAGIPEQVIHEITGILVPPGDAVALADALLRLLKDPILRQQLGQNGRKRFESNFTAEIAVQHYLDLYQGLRGA